MARKKQTRHWKRRIIVDDDDVSSLDLIAQTKGKGSAGVAV